MHFDTILKSLFQSSHLRLLESLIDAPIREWINVEIPKTQMAKLDLVAWLTDGRLYHLELQSGNDPDMPRRMLDYYLLLWKKYRVLPVQHLIYVGQRPLKMKGEIQQDRLKFDYRMIDIRELDSEVALRSPAIEDNILAILCRLNDSRAVVRRILTRIGNLPPQRRLDAMSQLLLLSGLRNLDHTVVEEETRMPIDIEYVETKFVKSILLKGKQEGIEEGIQEGRAEEARRLLGLQLERRFGSLSEATIRKLNSAGLTTLEDWSLRVLDAGSLDEVLQSSINPKPAKRRTR